MLLRALTVFALISGTFAGLVAGHSSTDDPVYCGGGEDHTRDVMPLPAANDRLYVVKGSDAQVTDPARYGDADATNPFSVWVESNNRLGFQSTAYECKYADGHVYPATGTNVDKRPVAPDTRLAPPTA